MYACQKGFNNFKRVNVCEINYRKLNTILMERALVGTLFGLLYKYFVIKEMKGLRGPVRIIFFIGIYYLLCVINVVIIN